MNDSCTSPTHLHCQKDANPSMILIMIITPRSANSTPQKANNSQVLCYHYFEPLPIHRHISECRVQLVFNSTYANLLDCAYLSFKPVSKKISLLEKSLFFVYKSIFSPSHRKYNEYSVDMHVLYYSCITADRIVLLPLSTATKHALEFINYKKSMLL